MYRRSYRYALLISTTFLVVLGLLLNPACSPDKTPDSGADVQEEPTLVAEQPRLTLLPAAETGIDFQNNIVETHEDNIAINMNLYNGGGVAVADINNDRLPDLYFISSHGKNRLYLNKGGWKFEDITDRAGVASEAGFETAATAVDINADGFLDFYVCRAGIHDNEDRRNRLYVNNGDLTFTERAQEYGLDDKSASTGANFFDADNDGDLDLYLLNSPPNTAYITRIEAKLGPDGKYVPQLHPRELYDSDRFYRNEGNGRFTDVSKEAGIWNLGYGLSVSVSDFNYDGYTDIYVGNDFIQPDRLYINNRNGTFTDRLGEYFRHCTHHTMGTDLTDFDNDGLVDLFAVDMLSANNYRRKTVAATLTQSTYTAMIQNGYFPSVVRNALQRNNGNGTFSDIGCLSGTFQTDWSWSGLLFDMDNDGWRDLHISNGYRREVNNRDFREFVLPELRKVSGSGKKIEEIYPNIDDFLKKMPTYKVRNYVYRNNGSWRFDDVSGKMMTVPPSWSAGSVWADFDKDGDLDLVVSNLEEPAFIYRNETAGQSNSNYLQLRLQGEGKNPFAIGASVQIRYAGGRMQYQEQFPTRGIFSSVEHLIHFGLGSVSRVDTVFVRWPNGRTQLLTAVPANQRLELRQSEANGPTMPYLPGARASATLLRDHTAASGLNFEHKENMYNDFENFPLNPWTESDLGPALARGDVNGDGLDDVYIGNSFDQPGALFVQQAGGRFRASSAAVWATDKIYEDHGAVFFDADGDKDADLFVVSGGAEATSPAAWQNRLYINDGKGNFSKSTTPLPPSSDIGMRVLAHDFDGDGDQDLFIGGRVTPGKWPVTPRSTILRNEGPLPASPQGGTTLPDAPKGGGVRFADVTSQVAPDFERCGMVTDLAWSDLDGDRQPELVVTGEWMPVMIFKNNGGRLQNATTQFGLERSNGIWYRLAAADVDGDGDQDLVTGNLGLNTRMTASDTEPLRCFAKDFDNNGTLDPIMAYHEQGKLHPLFQKDVLNKQVPVLKKKYLQANDFGLATMDQVWSQADLDAALNLYAYTLETSWWENQGGKFVRHALPLQTQTAPVQGIIIDDLNGDGRADILLAGNKYGMEVETNPCDAGNGVLLAGDGRGGFAFVPNLEAGFWATRETRDVAMLRGSKGQRLFVVANNNGKAQVFRRD